MSAPAIDARGAPIDQGRAQGVALRSRIAGSMVRQRAHFARLDWLWLRRAIRRGPAAAVGRHLPQQQERLAGIAAGAGVDELDLWIAASQIRLAGTLRSGPGPGPGPGTGAAGSDLLAAWHELPPVAAAPVCLRQSDPDAGGFPSAELVIASEAGCLAGVNANGIAVVCVDDAVGPQAPLRWLAQELLFRASDLDSGIDHLRRRAAYLGGSGRLVASAPDREPRSLCISAGTLIEQPISPNEHGTLAEPLLRIDPAARTLVWRHSDGSEWRAAPPESHYHAA